LAFTIFSTQVDLFLHRDDSAGQPIGGYTDTCETMLLQGIDLVGQNSDMREFDRSRLFDPSPLVFKETAYKGGEFGFKVLAVELGLVPPLKRGLHWEVEEAALRASLKTHTPDNLSVSGTRLVFQEEIILEQREVRRDSMESLTYMNKDCNLKDGIGI
jgi:hypothetical protein